MPNPNEMNAITIKEPNPMKRDGPDDIKAANEWFSSLIADMRSPKLGVNRKLDELGRDRKALFYLDRETGEPVYPFDENNWLKRSDDRLFDMMDYAREGRLFIRGLGKSTLHQIGAEDNKFQISGELTTLPTEQQRLDNMEIPPALTGFQKFLRAITFGLAYSGQARAYDEAMRERAAMSIRVEKQNLANEKLVAGLETLDMAEVRREPYLPEMDDARKMIDATENFKNRAITLAGTKPNFDSQYKQGTFKEADKEIITWDKKILDMNELQKGGFKGLDEHMLSILAFAPTTTVSPYQGVKGKKEFVDEEHMVMDGFTAHMVEDFLYKPRRNSGYYGEVLGNARDMVADALKTGDAEAMGKYLANGIIWTNYRLASVSNPGDSTAVYPLFAGLNEKFLEFMDANPAVMDAAKKAGLTEDQIQVARGTVQVKNILLEGAQAKLDILNAAAEGHQLPDLDQKLGKVHMMQFTAQEMILQGELNGQQKAVESQAINDKFVRDMKALDEMEIAPNELPAMRSLLSNKMNYDLEKCSMGGEHSDIVKALGSKNGQKIKQEMNDTFAKSSGVQNAIKGGVKEVADKGLSRNAVRNQMTAPKLELGQYHNVVSKKPSMVMGNQNKGKNMNMNM